MISREAYNQLEKLKDMIYHIDSFNNTVDNKVFLMNKDYYIKNFIKNNLSHYMKKKDIRRLLVKDNISIEDLYRLDYF